MPPAGSSVTVKHERSHDYDDSPDEASISGDRRVKKKQKRNKPTLSCEECVERKTKVRLYRVICDCATLGSMDRSLGRM